jgi:hypothetical protein
VNYITGNKETGGNSHIGHCTRNIEIARSYRLATIWFETIHNNDGPESGSSKIKNLLTNLKMRLYKYRM